MASVHGSNANLDAGVVPKVGAFVIEAALLAQRTACLLLLLVALQHGDDSVLMKIDSERRLSAADLVGVKEPLPENEDTGEMASQDPEDNGDGEGDDDDEGEDDSDDDMEGSDDDYSEADSDEESDEDNDDEDEDDEDEDEDEDDDDEEDDAQSQPPSKKKK
ncbi:pheromone-processing carboxypeptidase KEX1-like [Syzygium oleosum]|uniref:pheromone-processing carboxypeptidase KEX1-like n=1 Tax=Syzygium oleosum TaxID=219896 RepID=UPI0011D1F11A|nr:pheromone-processing carboxypeptidase KEX1-like [Syzygium oleosum]XP_056167144.1 pheromone-processing carboxypeptidase KEX1-like [Syzygium oleosum]XP_056167145.1 pheromone-processing carboxypeptidase KEX1-like [Syzygium oleosum]